MGMRFEELDDRTRECMIAEFDTEQATALPFVGADLSPTGRASFAELVRVALESEDDDTLTAAFDHAELWQTHQAFRRKSGSMGERAVNVSQRARLLGLNEFNTWYVRGLSARLLDEGSERCQIYRAAEPLWEPARECVALEGKVVSVRSVYDGHRAKYWPAPGDPTAFSLPNVPNCHHTIRRV
ncbi:MAG: hypothetical protein KY469_15895 [Actinobacteria bacterium]|nr:hypothetical protein [Actinomycetota bacterium]